MNRTAQICMILPIILDYSKNPFSLITSCKSIYIHAVKYKLTYYYYHPNINTDYNVHIMKIKKRFKFKIITNTYYPLVKYKPKYTNSSSDLFIFATSYRRCLI